MRPQRKFTDAELKRLHKTGITFKEIAEELGCSRLIVGKHAKRLGLKPPPGRGRPCTFTDEQLKQLYERGLNGLQMAEELGVSPSTVYNRLHSIGIRLQRRTVPRWSWRDGPWRDSADAQEAVYMALKVLLKITGPMTQREVCQHLEIKSHVIDRVFRKHPGIFQKAKLVVGSRRGSRKYGAMQLFNGLSYSKVGVIVYLAGDERIIPYIGSRLSKPQTQGELTALTAHLKNEFGIKWARRMIEYTGYQYTRV